MIAVSLLRVDKDAVRAVSTVYGLITGVVRLGLVTAAPGNVFDAAQLWPAYAGVVVASWAGFLAGTCLRRWADTETVVRVLLLLVLASAGILLGALTDAAVAVGFASGVGVLIILLGLLLAQPRLVLLAARTWRQIVASLSGVRSAPSTTAAVG